MNQDISGEDQWDFGGGSDMAAAFEAELAAERAKRGAKAFFEIPTAEDDHDDDETFDVDATFGQDREGYNDERDHWGAGGGTLEPDDSRMTTRMPFGQQQQQQQQQQVSDPANRSGDAAWLMYADRSQVQQVAAMQKQQQQQLLMHQQQQQQQMQMQMQQQQQQMMQQQQQVRWSDLTQYASVPDF